MVKVYARQTAPPEEIVTGSSGGVSTGKLWNKINSNIMIDREDIFMVIAEIISELWEKTGGAHCSVLFSGKELVAKSTDVGRHNTVDKVIGHCILNKIDMSGCVLGCTGRQPAGMISKAVNAGIPIVISKAATTDEGIRLADASGLTLVCRVKEGRFCVYTHPERIKGILTDDLKSP
jgi:FdhD protein